MYRREDSGKAISRIRWSDDGRKILAGGANGSLRLYHVGEEGTVELPVGGGIKLEAYEKRVFECCS